MKQNNNKTNFKMWHDLQLGYDYVRVVDFFFFQRMCHFKALNLVLKNLGLFIKKMILSFKIKYFEDQTQNVFFLKPDTFGISSFSNSHFFIICSSIHNRPTHAGVAILRVPGVLV